MKMRRALFISLLILSACFIWFKNLSLLENLDESLPVMLALPLYVWLGHPWAWCQPPGRPSWNAAAFGVLLHLAGLGINSVFLLSLAWCCWLYVFLKAYAVAFSRRLLLLPLLGFPWIITDCLRLSWFFRISAADAAGLFFRLAGKQVDQQGTLLTINGLPLSVEPACAGMNVLQSMLVIGFVLLYVRNATPIRFMAGISSLPVLAWVSNTARVISLGIAGLAIGPEFAMGWFHKWGGWMVLLLMFMAAQSFFSWIAPRPEEANS